MGLQIVIGTILILLNAVIAGLGFYLVERWIWHWSEWLRHPPYIAKRMVLLCSNVLWFLLALFFAISAWAGTYLWLGLFETVEEAIYFSIVAYTTLGFGDILLPEAWRLLAGLEALNGLLMIGLQTAMLIEMMGRVRHLQGRD